MQNCTLWRGQWQRISIGYLVAAWDLLRFRKGGMGPPWVAWQAIKSFHIHPCEQWFWLFLLPVLHRVRGRIHDPDTLCSLGSSCVHTHGPFLLDALCSWFLLLTLHHEGAPVRTRVGWDQSCTTSASARRIDMVSWCFHRDYAHPLPRFPLSLTRPRDPPSQSSLAFS